MVRSLRRAGQGRRGATLCLLVAAGLFGAACSSDAEVSVPSVELSTTTVTTLPPTTEAPSTTEAPTTTVDPRIAEVEAAVDEYHRVQVAVLTDPSVSLDEIDSVAVGAVGENAREFTAKIRAEGQVVSGEFVGVVLDVDFPTPDVAVTLECGLDALGSVDAAGAVVTPPDEQAFLRSYTLQRSAGGAWLVALVEFSGGERTACEL